MAVSTTYLAKVKMSLRVSSTALDDQIKDLIEEAKLNLTKTADIKTFEFDTADQLQSGAIIAYVMYKWYNDDKFLDAYNDLKMQMSTSSAYRPEVV